MDQPKYRIEIFWSDEDGGYIANVPDLHYCSAFGETYEEALREVLVAMELHLDTLKEEGRSVPEATTHRVIEASASGYAVAYDTVEVAGQAVEDDISESTGQALEDISEATGRILEEVSEAAQQVADEIRKGEGTISRIDVAVLTRREREVLEMIAKGLDNREIARNLNLSASAMRQQMDSAIKALSAARPVDEATLRALREFRKLRSR